MDTELVVAKQKFKFVIKEKITNQLITKRVKKKRLSSNGLIKLVLFVSHLCYSRNYKANKSNNKKND